MYPNSALAAWQLAVMAAVVVAALAVWLTAVYLADRQPRVQDTAASGSATDTTAETGAPPAGQAAGSGERAAA